MNDHELTLSPKYIEKSKQNIKNQIKYIEKELPQKFEIITNNLWNHIMFFPGGFDLSIMFSDFIYLCQNLGYYINSVPCCHDNIKYTFILKSQKRNYQNEANEAMESKKIFKIKKIIRKNKF